MKHLFTIGLCIGSLTITTSCVDDEPLDFKVEKPESVAVQEEIDAYDVLRNYVDRVNNTQFRLGAGVSVGEYNDKSVLYRLVNHNFDEVTAGYAMKHGAVVRADGSLNLTSVGEFFSLTGEKGLTVFGHTLCWHANQNASYLKGLISPLVVNTPTYANALDNAGLVDQTLTGWDDTNNGAGISVVDNEGLSGDVQAITLVANSASSNPEDLRLITPTIPVVDGHEYEVVFYIRSMGAGEGRITFEGLTNNTPVIDWMSTGTPTETFATGLGWREVRFRISDFTSSEIKIHFDLGYMPNTTYYIDVNNFYVYDTQGEPVISNLVNNGDFENGGAWGGWGTGSTRGLTEEGMGFGNTGKAFYVENVATTPGYWEIQTTYPFGENLENGETYTLSFWVKGTADGVIRPEFQSSDYSADGFGQVFVTTEWKKVSLEKTVTTADRERLIISYGEFAGTVYIDNVILSKVGGGGGETLLVEKTDEEKKIIIAGALENWIEGMVTFSKDHVKAWDVVNEPMDDGNPYELKTGIGKTLAADEFYWQDYLGKNYAVRAIELARQYGNSNDLLFINDYNLEYNIDKCKGIIEYVEYLEDQGVTVDGIGTQMHISTTSNKDKIVEMFELLAATGKLIKVSELDIGVNVKTNEATEEDYIAQAEMYKFVVEQYMEIIPTAQQYGITIWSPKDSPESSSWRSGEPIGLWTEAYRRKRAYSAVAEGLRGVN